MLKPKEHINEAARLASLYSYNLLDTIPEQDLDDLTALAAEICGTPIALISLVDQNRQWFKSNKGLDAAETSREVAFCAHAINESSELLIVEDAKLDSRFSDNPLVTDQPFVTFYAGATLKSDSNLPIGTICVIDHIPRKLNDKQISALRAISKQVMYLLELKKSQRIQNELRINCESKNKALDQFAYVAAHDLKSPLANISSLIKLFEQKYNDKLDDKGQLIMQSVYESSEKLRRLIDGLLKYSKTDELTISDKTEVDLNKLCDSLSIMLGFKNDLKLQLKTDLKAIYVNPTVIDQILINLITNAIKYCDKPHVDVELGVSENDTHYLFSVKDNGPGIAPKHHDKIFNIFEVMALKDKNGQRGNGIGLASVKKIVEKCRGEIKVESEIGKGANFMFSLAK